MARGAAAESVRSNDDVRLLVNHDGITLARTRSGTLELHSDDTGLFVRAPLDRKSPTVQSLTSAMERGDMDEMSFAFRALDQEWNDDYTERRINEVKLYDVSVVTFPANPATVAQLRNGRPPPVRGPRDPGRHPGGPTTSQSPRRLPCRTPPTHQPATGSEVTGAPPGQTTTGNPNPTTRGGFPMSEAGFALKQVREQIKAKLDERNAIQARIDAAETEVEAIVTRANKERRDISDEETALMRERREEANKVARRARPGPRAARRAAGTRDGCSSSTARPAQASKAAAAQWAGDADSPETGRRPRQGEGRAPHLQPAFGAARRVVLP